MSGLRFRAVRPAEIAVAAQQSIEAFGGDPARQEAVEARLREALDAGELWGIDGDGALLGHCRLVPVDHFFGGRAVRCLDVAGVAVSAKHRRRGVATALMEAAVAWGAHQGMALSLLFPGVPSLYRRLGWDMAGTFPRYELPPSLIAPRSEAMRQAVDADWPAIGACHEAYAAALNGPGRRQDARWALLRRGAAYVLDGAHGVEAYAIVYQGADPAEPPGSPPSVDWGATTGRGMRAVIALLASGTLPSPALLHAPPASAWGIFSDTWHLPSSGGLYWMARPLVLPAAIADRGYPAAVSGSVTMAIDDRLLSEVRGPWHLEVGGGKAQLSPATSAEVLLDVRAVGPLYTGFRTPRELALAGLLDGPPDAVELLGAMFAGSAPVALDFF